jgi:hypothetical protein
MSQLIIMLDVIVLGVVMLHVIFLNVAVSFPLLVLIKTSCLTPLVLGHLECPSFSYYLLFFFRKKTSNPFDEKSVLTPAFQKLYLFSLLLAGVKCVSSFFSSSLTLCQSTHASSSMTSILSIL